MKTLNDVIDVLKSTADQLESAAKAADAKRVRSLVTLFAAYEAPDCSISKLGSLLRERKPKRASKRATTTATNVPELAGPIVAAFRRRDVEEVKRLFEKKSSTIPVVKWVCDDLGYSFKTTKTKTVDYLIDTLNDFHKQSVRG